MPEHPVDLVPRLDSALLNDIVRQDQRDPNFEVTTWSVESLSDKGIINPDGLFRVHGQGVSGAGERAWSVVLKALRDPGEAQALSSLWHWRREALAARGAGCEVGLAVVIARAGSRTAFLWCHRAIRQRLVVDGASQG